MSSYIKNLNTKNEDSNNNEEMNDLTELRFNINENKRTEFKTLDNLLLLIVAIKFFHNELYDSYRFSRSKFVIAFV